MARPGRILIFAAQPIVAALVGMMVEHAGYQPLFAAEDELALDAIKRLRPQIVVLVDCAMDEARSDLFFANTAKLRVPVALFGPRGKEADLERLAEGRGVSWFALPPNLDQLSRAIETASNIDWWTRTSERRKPSEEEASSEGFRFKDRSGQTWTVFDRRRAGDRRQPVAEHPESVVVERLFVNERGQRFSCEILLVDADDASLEVLENQLSRAVPL